MTFYPVIEGLTRGFYDDKNNKLKLPASLKVKFVKINSSEGHRFQLVYKGTAITPVLIGLDLNGNILTCHTLNASKIDIDLNNMYVYPEYFRKINSVASGENGEAYFIHSDGRFSKLPYKLPYNILNGRARANSGKQFSELIALENEEGFNAVYNSKDLSQIIPFEIKGIVDICAYLGNTSSVKNTVFLIQSSDDSKVGQNNETYSFYSGTGKMIEQIKNVSLMWVKPSANNEVAYIAFQTGDKQLSLMVFDNKKSEIIQKLQVTHNNINTANQKINNISQATNVTILKDGSLVLITQKFNSSKTDVGLLKIGIDGKVQEIEPNDEVSVFIDQLNSESEMSGNKKRSKIAEIIPEPINANSANGTLSEFSSIAQKYFPQKPLDDQSQKSKDSGLQKVSAETESSKKKKTQGSSDSSENGPKQE